jgi:hypothetical protein
MFSRIRCDARPADPTALLRLVADGRKLAQAGEGAFQSDQLENNQIAASFIINPRLQISYSFRASAQYRIDRPEHTYFIL